MGSRSRQILTKDIRIITGSTITRPSNTTAYTAGDALSDVTTNNFVTFLKCLEMGTKTGEIVAAKALVSSYVATAPDIDLMLFHTTIAEKADNSPATISDDEMATLIGVINFATGSWKPGDITSGAGGNQAQFVKDINMPIKLVTGTDGLNTIFAQPIMRNAYAPIASEVYTFQLYIRQD